jgi:hypothetical protein
MTAFGWRSRRESRGYSEGRRRYSIYSIKDGGKNEARGITELRGQESTP